LNDLEAVRNKNEQTVADCCAMYMEDKHSISARQTAINVNAIGTYRYRWDIKG
jgi:hypothetical protein